ncbi:replication initiation protein [Burkholderia gladioli]|uniref:replication initiation protein n=1 Tax=Burkholderia gladioli TaxID=28095 RepID=UPI003F7A0428
MSRQQACGACNSIEGYKMNVNTRLNTVAPDLVEFGEGLSANKRNAVARSAAEWACRETSVISFLDEGRVKLLLEDGYAATQQDRDRLAGDVDDLDEKYFTIVEQHDGLDDAGEALQWFRKARAAASLLYSLDSDAVLGFCETLYEVQAATNDLDALKSLCRR